VALAAGLAATAVAAPVAHGRQLSAARASFHISFQGSYSATASSPVDDCSRWVGSTTEPFAMTALATETGHFHSIKAATVSFAGPFGSFPLTEEGQRFGRLSLAINRSSNVHSSNGRPDGCDPGNDPGSPQQTFPGDCGLKSRKVGFSASNVRAARTNRSKASILVGYSLNDPFHACGVPGGIFIDNFQQKAELAAERKTLPRVSRLFSGSSRIIEHGSATVRGVGTDQGSKVTYTMRVKVTLRRTKLQRPRTG
jgi:hypothetical protein